MKRDQRVHWRRVATKRPIITSTAATANAIGSWTTNASMPAGAMAPNKMYQGIGSSRSSSLIGDQEGEGSGRSLGEPESGVAGAAAFAPNAAATNTVPQS